MSRHEQDGSADALCWEQKAGWTVRDNRAEIARWERQGTRHARTTLDDARMRVAEDGERIHVTDADGSAYSRRQIFALAERLHGALIGLGLVRNDVVAYQLPNWHEAIAIGLAAAMGGFILNPIMPIYRDAELAFMLRDSGARLMFIPASFRNHDFAAMLTRLRGHLPGLDHVVVVRGEAGPHTRFDTLVSANIRAPFASVDPDDVKLLMYTSGTTGKAKGVLHSHAGLGAETTAQRDYWACTDSDVMFMPSPVAHITGVLDALELPWLTGMRVVLQDVWHAQQAVESMRQNGATIAVTATPFLAEVVDVCESVDENLPSLRIWPLGGAPVPPQLVRRARAQFPQCNVARAYGSSELPTATMGVPDAREADLAADTDGQIFRTEVAIRNPDNGIDCAAGEEGEIAVRGPELFLGYTDEAATREAFWPDGYFRTGDLGRLVHSDRLVITGRMKDIIIRGGENLSPVEIEDALIMHHDIREAAVVAMPSARMGETVCAFLVVRSGGALDRWDIAAHLKAVGLAPQKFPEWIEIVSDLPRTPSGKVRKDILRDQASTFAPSKDRN